MPDCLPRLNHRVVESIGGWWVLMGLGYLTPRFQSVTRISPNLKTWAPLEAERSGGQVGRQLNRVALSHPTNSLLLCVQPYQSLHPACPRAFVVEEWPMWSDQRPLASEFAFHTPVIPGAPPGDKGVQWRHHESKGPAIQDNGRNLTILVCLFNTYPWPYMIPLECEAFRQRVKAVCRLQQTISKVVDSPLQWLKWTLLSIKLLVSFHRT